VDAAEVELLEEALTKVMAGSGTQDRKPASVLEAGLEELGWREMLAQAARDTVPVVFRVLGEAGAQAPVLNDVLLHAAGREPGGTPAMPYAGGRWVRWLRTDAAGDGAGAGLDPELPLITVQPPESDLGPVALAAGRRALGWWLLGTGHAMLTLAGRHVLDRTQFGRPLASFQAVRHKLAETLVALEGAQAALMTAGDDADELSALLGKAAAGRGALTAARHCQQVLGGIGFTAEHELHRHVRRALVLDGLLGSTHELTRTAGRHLVSAGRAPRLVDL
jgi:hypothetical protein